MSASRSTLLIVLIGLLSPSAKASPTPTRLDLGPGATRPVVPDEQAPKPGSQLPTEVGAPKPKPKPKPKVVRKRRKAPSPRRIRRVRSRAPGVAVQVDVGQISAPRSLVSLAGQVNQFPDLYAYTVDINVLRTGRGNHAWGGRLGLAFPQVPAANWYLSTDGAKRPVFTEIDLVGVDLAFTYRYRRRLLGPLGVTLRAGAGLMIAGGSVKRVQTLPTCGPDQYATCPHWREAATEPNALPSAIWPTLRATGGLFLEFSRFSVSAEAGLRGAVYFGAGVAVRL